MSKTVKRIISSLLVFSAIATVEPVNYINFITQKAEASTFNSSDYALLDSLDSDEGDIHFSDTRSTVTLKVSSSVDEVKLTAKADDSDYEVTIDGDEETGENSKTLELDHGSNRFTIKVKDPDGDKKTATYHVRITRGSSSDDDDNDDEDDVYLDDMNVSGNSISFSRTKKSYNVEVGESIDKVRIYANPEDEDDTVKINGTEVDNDDNYKRWVSLNHGKNEIKVKVEDDDDDGYYRTYTLNIYRGVKAPADTSSSETTKEERQGSIYLDNLNLADAGGANIYFEPKVTNYDANVSEDIDTILVKAEVDDDDDDDDVAEVNGEKVGTDDYKRVSLQKGKNVIKVKVHNNYDSDDDDYEQRTYTINVNRGSSDSTTNNTGTSNSSSGTTPTTVKDTKANQWVEVNGKWQYNDSLGNPLKSQWFFDRNHGKWYYLGADGNMQIGWILENGKYYFLYDDGSMASNTTIGQYNVGNDGSWIR